MHPNRTSITKIVLETLCELGADLDKPELQEAEETTRLFGARSALDSMNLVNFIADVEERICDEYQIEIVLANESAMSLTHSPFRTAASCIDYIMELITEATP
jgi:acyl carrier protein